ncbi:protein SOSEKI 4 [Mercurialis annua]|uniref:protein SOSEKI 4 n=1 Tax=Mercurialis annua TaxID=3986 RepID=UPI0021609A3E|nr:protein SOSEKI 4 [Mercurialis annua]
MAVSSSRAPRNSLATVPNKFRDTNHSTTTNNAEHKSKYGAVEKRVHVVYYLSRNGQLEHPHFIEVPLSNSSHGLYLRDVIDRLNILRGKGMASLYSWSSKRSYKNGFVWHDLAENDFIYPAHGHEYVLKGSELVQEPSSLGAVNPNSNKLLLLEATSSPSSKPLINHKSSSSDQESPDFPPAITRRRNQSWSSPIDLNEYKVYKTESLNESNRKLAADAATQTDDKRRRRKLQVKEEEEEEEFEVVSREEIEISPPPSDSSPETLESLMKADGRLILGSGGDSNNKTEESLNRTVENCGRIKASTVLMQLISCGSISFRDCGATAVKDQGLSLIGHYKGRLPRGGGGSREGILKEFGGLGGVRLEDKEYFSGSLVETKKIDLVPALKKSNSYNADRSTHLQLAEKEVEGTRTRCIPRKPKAIQIKKETGDTESNINSQPGSKRFEVEKIESVAK